MVGHRVGVKADVHPADALLVPLLQAPTFDVGDALAHGGEGHLEIGHPVGGPVGVAVVGDAPALGAPARLVGSVHRSLEIEIPLVGDSHRRLVHFTDLEPLVAGASGLDPQAPGRRVAGVDRLGVLGAGSGRIPEDPGLAFASDGLEPDVDPVGARRVAVQVHGQGSVALGGERSVVDGPGVAGGQDGLALVHLELFGGRVAHGEPGYHPLARPRWVAHEIVHDLALVGLDGFGDELEVRNVHPLVGLDS